MGTASDLFTPEKLREVGLAFPGQALTWALQDYLPTQRKKNDPACSSLDLEPRFTEKKGKDRILIFGLSDMGQDELIGQVVKYFNDINPTVPVHWVKQGELCPLIDQNNRSIVVIEDFDQHQGCLEMVNPIGQARKTVIALSSKPWDIGQNFLQQAFKIPIPQPTTPQKAALLNIFLARVKDHYNLETMHKIGQIELEKLAEKKSIMSANWTEVFNISLEAHDLAYRRKFGFGLNMRTDRLPENVRKGLVVELKDLEKAVLTLPKREGENERRWLEKMNDFLNKWPVTMLPDLPDVDECGWQKFEKPDNSNRPNMSFWECLLCGIVEMIETSF